MKPVSYTHLSLISEEEKARWTEKFEEARDLSEHTEELEELDELFAKDSIKRMEGAAAMVKAWKLSLIHICFTC